MRLTVWVSLSIVLLLAANPTLADPPHGKGGGKPSDAQRGYAKGKDKDRADDRHEDRGHWDRGGRERPDGRHVESYRAPARVGRHFEDRHRTVVREYYVTEYRYGHCPPGLAKKNNGCMPPGLAKKWHRGHPLPHEVVFYDVPPALVVQIGTPPPGHRYVRVAADILLIAVGTGMVIDAITDLGNL